MGNDLQQKYIEGLKVYHEKLTQAVKQNYGLDTEYLEVLSWGYHTTAIYLKSRDNKEYLLKLADWSEEKERGILKDIELSNKLRGTIPTPIYLKNLSDSYICRFEDKIIRLSHYISGLSPLDINFDILDQMVNVLKKIHYTSRRPNSTNDDVLLHGDLTPHNVLVSFGKIVAVVDFEMSFIGPREWDLARTAFFSWNYMKNAPFDKVAQVVLETYANNSVDTGLFYKYAVENAQTHLASVEKHRSDYDQQAAWEKDRDFAKKQLEIMVGPAQSAGRA
jgi:Ser/Thr protein kinase RdoA (MazF antagonist)